MPVPAQTPYIEYTGNGSTTSFPLTFDCDNADYLQVAINDVAVPIGEWLLSRGNVIFKYAPTINSVIVIRRNTPLMRIASYRQYDNSFRPEAINKDFDRIWHRLQEHNVTTDLNQMWTKEAIKEQEALTKQNQLEFTQALTNETQRLATADFETARNAQQYTDTMIRMNNTMPTIFDGFSTNIVMDPESGKNQQQINNVTVQTAESVADLLAIKNPKNGQTVQVKSYHAGLNKGGGVFFYDSTKVATNNSGTIISGWLRQDARVSVEDFGAKGDGVADDTQAIQAALNAMTEDSKLYFNSVYYHITDTLIIKKSNIRLIGQKCKVAFSANVDKAVFVANNLVSIDIDGIGSANSETAGYFIVANSVHHLHVTNADFHGIAWLFQLKDCYWTKLDALRCQAAGRLFGFFGGTNAFCLTNVSVQGEHNTSIIDQAIGGSIVGCSFEGASGRIEISRSRGLNICGNYFEGYGNVDTYIRLMGANFKDNAGINIAGNLFYSGANFELELQNVGGVNITGNYIGVGNGTRLYSFDDSTQTDINYSGNYFSGNGEEFYYAGKADNASMSPEYKFPLIFQKQKLSARKLQAGESQILNVVGDLSVMRANSDASAIMTASDLSAFFRIQKMYKDKTISSLLSEAWASEKLSITDDTSLTGAKLYTSSQSGIAKLYQAPTLTVGHQYALIFKAKRNTDKNLFITYKDQAVLPNYVSDYVLMKNTSWGYTGLGFSATASTMSVGIVSQETMQSGENFSIAESYLIDLTATFGSEIPSAQALTAALNSM